MTITANRSQLIWTPLFGWALLSLTTGSAWAQIVLDPTSSQTPADVTVVPGGAVPPAGPTGQLPPYTIPGVTGPATIGGTTLGSTSTTPAPKTPSPIAPDNPLTPAPSVYSSTGQILNGAPLTLQTFAGGGDGGEELGVTYGAFTLYPSIDITVGYDNNVYAQNAATGPVTGALLTTFVPQVALQSNWLRHSMRGVLGGGFGVYAGNSNQNYQNYNTSLDFTFDITDDLRISPSIGFRRATEAVGTPNTAISTAPTVDDSVPLKLGIYQRFNRFYYDISGTATRHWYQDNGVVASTSLPAASRDRWEYTEQLRFGYEISEDFALYVAPTFSQTRYMLKSNIDDQDRDQNQSGVGLGATWTISPTSSFDGGLGFSGTSGTSTWVGRFSGSWNGYEPLTLRPTFSRSIDQSALSQYQNVVTTAIGVPFSYVINSDWMLTGGLSYTTAQYVPIPGTTSPPRVDTIFRGGLGLMYNLRPQVSIGPNWEYTSASSTDPVNGPFYTRQIFSVRLTARR